MLCPLLRSPEGLLRASRLFTSNHLILAKSTHFASSIQPFKVLWHRDSHPSSLNEAKLLELVVASAFGFEEICP